MQRRKRQMSVNNEGGTAAKKTSKAKSIYSKVTMVIAFVALTVVIVAFISLFAQVAGGKKPSIFGYRLYFILTDSMTPELEVNDSILSEVINGGDEARDRVKEGDVITFVAAYGPQTGLTITHKVIKAPYFDSELGKEVVLTQGVKEGAPVDPPVPIENIQAVMVRRLPFIGKFYKFVMSGVGLALLIVVPLVLMLGILVFRLITEIRRKEKPLTPEQVAEKAAYEAEIKRKAVEEYILLEERKAEIARKAVEEYIKANEKAADSDEHSGD